MEAQTTYKITKLFIGGILEGLTHTSFSTVKMAEGLEVKKPVGGSPYLVIECKEVR